jgi:hypothetical protein
MKKVILTKKARRSSTKAERKAEREKPIERLELVVRDRRDHHHFYWRAL